MATTPQAASKSPTIRRILREAAEISNSPSPDYTAEPLETDLFEWHFTLRGAPNSPFSEGLYHGRIVLPPTYPLRPPSFRFMTPNGRFEANREICLSISGHHEETWQPAWGIRTAIVALRSFMTTDAKGQIGGFDATEPVRRRLATESHDFRCAVCGRSNADIIKECEQRAAEAAGPSGEQEGEEVQVPDELKLGFRDEMEAAARKAKEEQEKEAEEDAETAELAEGFVQTAPPTSSSNSSPPPPPTTGTTPTTSGVDVHGISGQQQQQQARHRTVQPVHVARPPQQVAVTQPNSPRASDEAVPVWIDRLIVALVVVLAALVLKVLYGV